MAFKKRVSKSDRSIRRPIRSTVCYAPLIHRSRYRRVYYEQPSNRLELGSGRATLGEIGDSLPIARSQIQIPASRACAENGTLYLDVTAEALFVARMIRKYEDVIKPSGATMLPQIGTAAEIAMIVHTLSSSSYGGSSLTALSRPKIFTLMELKGVAVPFAMSPISNPDAPTKSSCLLARLTGLVDISALGGLLTTSFSKGLLQAIPARIGEFYGHRFTFRQYMKAPNKMTGNSIYISLIFPGEGPDKEAAEKEVIEFRGVASPDIEGN
ncbi:hypothetical protein K469DRAFT_685261 [Zopfia rhizophila CBS 207.26]|uniref:Uncharacterized protein n=1 Tax=Zopfia rhizophila CBS 207.26 TaxID=1314779 RepID=A0A6A6EAS0_9PEZI|nr:hypothetical protein K469DRAFT_685261 [Zopfia rhizophila CBS 207.26]